MAEVFSEPCVRVQLERVSGVLHYVRTEEPYASLAELTALHARLGRVLDRLGRDKHVLLVDMRRAVMNNDPGFEKAAEGARRVLVRGFPRVAVLVATAVGALQVKRHVREDGREMLVCTSEPEARAYLTGPAEVEAPPTSGVAPSSDGPFQGLPRRSGRR